MAKINTSEDKGKREKSTGRESAATEQLNGVRIAIEHNTFIVPTNPVEAYLCIRAQVLASYRAITMNTATPRDLSMVFGIPTAGTNPPQTPRKETAKAASDESTGIDDASLAGERKLRRQAKAEKKAAMVATAIATGRVSKVGKKRAAAFAACERSTAAETVIVEDDDANDASLTSIRATYSGGDQKEPHNKRKRIEGGYLAVGNSEAQGDYGHFTDAEGSQVTPPRFERFYRNETGGKRQRF